MGELGCGIGRGRPLMGSVEIPEWEKAGFLGGGGE